MGSEAAASERGNDGVLECCMTNALPPWPAGDLFALSNAAHDFDFLLVCTLGERGWNLKACSVPSADMALRVGSFRANVWFC